jgi:hypothetical protein
MKAARLDIQTASISHLGPARWGFGEEQSLALVETAFDRLCEKYDPRTATALTVAWAHVQAGYWAGGE